MSTLLKEEEKKKPKVKIDEETTVIENKQEELKVSNAKLTQKEEEAREIMEVSMIDDDEDILLPEEKEKPNEKEPAKVQAKIISKAITLSANSVNMQSTIFNELCDIDLEAEFREDESINVDWNSVCKLY